MNWISFTVPASRNDLFSELLALCSRRGSLVRAHHCEKGDRVLKMSLDTDGAHDAEMIMAGEPSTRGASQSQVIRAATVLDFL